MTTQPELTSARAILALLLLWANGCTPYVHSPPGRLIALDTAQTLAKGETGIRVVGGGGGGDGDLEFGGLAARVRHGLANKLDVRIDLSALKLIPEEPLVGTEWILSAGTGIKYAFNPHFAFSVDVTGGGWEGGGFISPELKLITGYENPYAVPFVDVGYYTSHPISANSVRTTERLLGPPTFTHGWTTGVGLRIVTSRLGQHVLGSGLILGIRFTGAYFDDPLDESDRRNYLVGGGGFEVVVP